MINLLPFLFFAAITFYGLLTEFKKFKATNYRQKQVFLSGFFLVSALFFLSRVSLSNHLLLSLVESAFFISLIGLLDDLFGGKEKGFKGHLKALLRGKITTGFLKLTLITFICFYSAFLIEKKALSALLSGLILSSASNFFNLLDLRPGRATKPALLVFLIGALFLKGEAKVLAVLLIFLSLAHLVLDLKELVMLGDAGSNALGFFAATILLFLVKITLFKVLLAVLLVGLNFASEKVSFTYLIEKNRLLRMIDEFGRKK